MRRAMVFLGVVALGVMLALATVAVAQADAPFFAVSPIEPPGHMWGEEWAPDDEVAITIDDPDVSGAVNFSTTASTDGEGRFELNDMPFDIEAGHIVTVTQGATVKTHEVIDLTVTLLDPVNDIITGLGASNTETVVHIGESRLVVMSGDDGVWMADFSGVFDILPGMVTYVYQADADGDQTQIDYHVPNFGVGVHDNGIAGEGWPASADVVFTVGDPTTTEHPDVEVVCTTNEDGVFHYRPLPELQPG